jgi:hypothetical protein
MAENNKGQYLKNIAGKVIILCAALLLNEIHPPKKFQVDTSNTF